MVSKPQVVDFFTVRNNFSQFTEHSG